METQTVVQTRTLDGFRIRGVVAGSDHQYQIQMWTRKMGGNAPEKCWLVEWDGPFTSQDEATRRCQRLFKNIRGVRYDGEPEYSLD